MTVRLPRVMVMCDGARRCVMGRADCVRKRPCPPRGHDDFVVVCPGVKGLVSPELRVANDVLCQNRGGVHTTRRRVRILQRSRVGVFPGGSEDCLTPCTGRSLQWVSFLPSCSPCSDHRPALQ